MVRGRRKIDQFVGTAYDEPGYLEAGKHARVEVSTTVTKNVIETPGSREEALASTARRAVRHLRLGSRFGSRARTSSRNDTEHLLASPANAERLRAAVRSSLAGEGMIMTMEDLRRQMGLG